MTNTTTDKSPIHSFLSLFLTIHPHETHTVFYSTSSFFFVLSAYFVVLPLRDEGAISLDVISKQDTNCFIPLLIWVYMLQYERSQVQILLGANDPEVATPTSPKGRALPGSVAVGLSPVDKSAKRFFSASLVLFFILWVLSSPENTFPSFKGFLNMSSTIKEDLKIETQPVSTNATNWDKHGWFYITVALLNLITVSSTWARVADVMDNESGSRLFGFIGAGATFGQLFGSLFATGLAWLGPYLLLFASLMMEFAAQSSKRINKDLSDPSEELHPLRETVVNQKDEIDQVDTSDSKESLRAPPSSTIDSTRPRFWALLDGFWLIWSSSYLLWVSLFLWLSAVTSSFFYFQKVTVIASTVTTATGRRRLFAQINSFIAVFILAGQLTLTGRILTVAGITIALCAAPFTAFLNSIAIAVWPTYIAVAVSETFRKVVMYVVTRPGRELLFTVVSQDEKYKAKVCIDVLVQRFGDATAAGMYKLLHSTLNGKITHISLYALPNIEPPVSEALHACSWTSRSNITHGDGCQLSTLTCRLGTTLIFYTMS
ncbi:TLC ATP/ADP transporter [Tanacetum coccineum]